MQKFYNYTLVEDIAEVVIPECAGKTAVVNCLNPHSFVTALDDAVFRYALEKSDFLLPDGEGVCIVTKKYKGIDLQKIAGDDIHHCLLKEVAKKSGKVFYMGSTERVLNLIEQRIKKEYPSITVRTLSPSFCDELSEDESMRIVDEVNEFEPDVMFVSMTAPKQEKWVERYRRHLKGVKMIASIGAVFDFYACTVRRAPKWMIQMKIEWLYRFLNEPLRMWKRVFVSTPRFLRYTRKMKVEI
ncbi:MAG: WecB/TagA/CpsF family glycosyltransferase [Bacteroidales bacterium]|nr:WecB/TagA/CpsF family glycosyltransferase [Bacteroidales bacterium]